MRLTFLRTLAAILVLIAINSIVNACIPPFWGNERAWVKFNALKDRADEINIIVMGDSNIAYQLDPNAFNDLKIGETPVRVFNMGVSAQRIEEQIYFYHKILESGIRPKIALLQVGHTLSTPKIWNGTARGEYYLTLPTLWRIRENLSEAGKDAAWQRMILKEYISLYLRKVFHINLATILEKTYLKSLNTAQILGPENNGFFSVEGFDGEEWMEERQQNVRDNPDIFERFSRDVRTVENALCDEMMLDRNMRSIDTLRELSMKYGVRPVFYVGLPNRYKQVKCMLDRIPASEKLESITTKEAPDLFDPANYFDAYHLKLVQAKKYSLLFAKKLNAFLIQEGINDQP